MGVEPMLIDFGMAITTNEEVLFAEECKCCLYGLEGDDHPYSGLLGIVDVEDTHPLEVAFNTGYCSGRGFNGN